MPLPFEYLHCSLQLFAAESVTRWSRSLLSSSFVPWGDVLFRDLDDCIKEEHFTLDRTPSGSEGKEGWLGIERRRPPSSPTWNFDPVSCMLASQQEESEEQKEGAEMLILGAAEGPSKGRGGRLPSIPSLIATVEFRRNFLLLL